MGMTLFLASWPYPPALAALGHSTLGLVTGVCVAAYLSPLWLNPRGHYVAARVLPVLSACAALCSVIAHLGPGFEVQLAFFFVACWPFQLFDVKRERGPLLGLLALTLGALLTVQLERFSLDTLEATGELMWLRSAMTVSTVLLFGATLWFFYSRNQSVEDELGLEVRRRALAQQSLETAKAELVAALGAKTDFLALMSHELRSPLNGVLAGADLLDSEKLPDDQKELVEAISVSGRQLTQLLEGIWDFVSLDAQDVDLLRAPVDIGASLEASVRDFVREAGRKGLELDVVIEAAEPLALGDAGKIERLSRCIVDNAVRCTKSGWVTLRASTRRRGETIELHVEVRDTGPGFPPEMLRRAFEAFQQSSGLRQRGVEGVGLGLTLAYRLATLMSGSVQLDNHPEGGALVRWSLELDAADDEAELGPPKTRRAPLPAARVEVDNPRARDSLVAVLARLQCPLADGQDEAGLRFSDRDRAGGARAGIDLLRGDRLVSQLQRPLDARSVEAALRAASAELASLAHRGKHKALLVEDNRINRIVLTRMLVGLGLEVTQAEDGVLGVEAWRPGEFLVVVTDIQMPRMDGLQLMAEIRQKEHDLPPESRVHSRTPFIVVTANASPEQRAECEVHGIQDYLTKPCSKEDLARVLERLRASTEDHQPFGSSAYRRAPSKVLLAEDTDINGTIMTRMLTRLNCIVTRVEDGREAVACYEAGAFDLVFMDIFMPNMNGLEAIARIREHEAACPPAKRRRVPIVVITANGGNAQRAQAERLDIDGYLVKPIAIEHCREILAHIGEREAESRSSPTVASAPNG